METSDGRDQPDASLWSYPNDPKVTTQGGYPVDIFPWGCDDKFKCDMCHLILKDPLQAFCGHRFCKMCVENAQVQSQQQGSPVRCQSCVDDGAEEEFIELKIDQMFPDNAVKREMSNVSVVCINPGCSWTGKFKTYPKHHVECEFQPVTCDCGRILAKVELLNHQEKDCPSRKISCKYCSEQIMFADRENHNQVCPKLPIKCESCRKKKIPRDKMKDHLENECTNPRLPCPLGCAQLVEKSKMDDHIQTNISTHLAAVVDKTNSFDRRIQEIQTQTAQNTESLIVEMQNILRIVGQDLQRVASHNQPVASTSTATVTLSYANPPNTEIMQRMKTYEEIMTVLHTEGQRCITALENLERQREADKRTIDMNEQKIRTLEHVVAVKDVTIAEMDIRLNSAELASFNGTLCWKISDFSRKWQEAITGRTTSIYSPAFYTDRMGYKMCARLYPNGDGMGKGSHLSLFFVLMRGNYDALLKFPFKQKVTLMLLDQSGKEPPENVVDAFRPDPASSSFKRPTTEMNIASGCPLFMQLQQLHASPDKYIKDDTVFIKVIVDCTGAVSAK